MSSDDSNRQPDSTRRTVLKGLAGLGAAGVIGAAGIGTLTSSAAAFSVNIGATNPGRVENDRGDVSRVTIDPQFTVQWENFDDAVGKIFYLVEAKVGNGDFIPLFRATPWLPGETTNNSYVKESPIGTTGEYRLKHPLSVLLNQAGAPSARPLVVADDDGVPDYAGVDWTTYSPSEETRYLNGVSMGTASEAQSFFDQEGEVLQNNFPSLDAGYYGAASDTIPFDNPDDGSNKATGVTLRYTFELQRPNLSQLGYTVDMANHPDHSDWSQLTTEEKKQFAVEEVDGLKQSDIDEGNSKIVMNGEDGNTNFGNPTGIPYANLRNNAADHVGIISTTASFAVTARNQPADSGATGSSNPGAQ